MRRWLEILLATTALAIFSCACGGPFDSVDRVVSLDGSQVCVASASDTSMKSVHCADPTSVGSPDGITVGTCVQVHHAGESARVLEVKRVVGCPIESATTTS
jgi:hypothetical protein